MNDDYPMFMLFMLLGTGGVFGALLLLNVPLERALLVVVLMACPWMIVVMMDGNESRGAGDYEERPMGRQGEGERGSTHGGRRH